jgi:alpha-L-rhamnosidase
VEYTSGFSFSAEGNHFLMWQVSTNPSITKNGTTPYLRPHIMSDNYTVLAEIPITNVIPDTPEGRTAWYRMRIVVRKPEDNKVSITTSMAPVGSNFITVDENRSLDGSYELKKIGFRQVTDEVAEYDNITIYNNEGGKNDVIYNETFDIVPRADFGSHGTIIDGVFRVILDTFTTESNIVDRKPYDSGYPLFRKVINISEGFAKARLYATARGFYEYSINGEKVGDQFLAPGWTDYFFTIMYQAYDVTKMLKVGSNAIGAMIGLGWYSGPHMNFGWNMYGSTQSVLGKLVIEYKNGTRQVVVTDNTWKYHGGPVFSASTYYGEDYDAQYDCAGWNTADYNDSDWVGAAIHEPLAESVDLINQEGPPVRVVHRFENPVFSEPLPGKYTYDFGQNMAGVVSIKVKGPAGTRLKIRHAEMLNTDIAYQNPGEDSVKGGDGPPGTVYRANLREGNIAINYYTLKGDPNGETFIPHFTFHGFRYVEISGINTSIPASDVTALALSADDEMTSAFETSHPKVNKLYSNVIWGMRSNFVSVPTDCPNRNERLGWAGDAQVFSLTASYLANTNQFYSKWLRDLRSYQMNKETSERDKGLVPVVIPAVYIDNLVIFGNFWGDAAVTVPWMLYKQFRDIRIVRESIDSMRAWCDFLNAEPRTVDFIRLGSNVPRDAQYGDWVSVENSPKDMTNTLGTAYVNKLFSKMAAIVGLTDDAKKYSEISDNFVQAFNKKFTVFKCGLPMFTHAFSKEAEKTPQNNEER